MPFLICLQGSHSLIAMGSIYALGCKETPDSASNFDKRTRSEKCQKTQGKNKNNKKSAECFLRGQEVIEFYEEESLGRINQT